MSSRFSRNPSTALSFYLEFKNGPGRGQRVQLEQDQLTIGRDQTCEIYLRDIEASRRHAEIRRTDHGFEVVDLNSSNGLFIDERKIDSYQLKAGDTLRIGQTIFEFGCETPDVDQAEVAKPHSGSSVAPSLFDSRNSGAGQVRQSGTGFENSAELISLAYAEILEPFQLGLQGSSQVIQDGLRNQSLENIRDGRRILDRYQKRLGKFTALLKLLDSKGSIELQVSRLESVVEKIVKSNLKAALQNDVELSWQFQEDLPSVRIDESAFQLVLEATIDAAVDSCHSVDSGQIEVQVLNDKPRKLVRVVVVDNGPGMGPEQLLDCADPFKTQGDNRLNRFRYFVARSVMRQHGGNFELFGQVDRGCQCNLVLPAARLKGSDTIHGQ